MLTATTHEQNRSPLLPEDQGVDRDPPGNRQRRTVDYGNGFPQVGRSKDWRVDYFDCNASCGYRLLDPNARVGRLWSSNYEHLIKQKLEQQSNKRDREELKNKISSERIKSRCSLPHREQTHIPFFRHMKQTVSGCKKMRTIMRTIREPHQ